MQRLNLPNRFSDAGKTLVAGAGGGFDIYSGLPVWGEMSHYGDPLLANLSFTKLDEARCLETERHHPAVYRFRGAVEACPTRNFLPYFPEGYLAQFFGKRDVYAFPCVGVNQLRSAYQWLVDTHQIDTIVLVDGGVDSIMRGDEQGRATIIEDTVSIAAVSGVKVGRKILACLGFGTEYDDGLCHYRALENMAALAADGAVLGGCQVVADQEGFHLMRDAYNYAVRHGTSQSHIAPRIIRAVEGDFEGGDPFVQPLMSQYWFFDLDKVMARNRLAADPLFCRTNTWLDVTTVAQMQFRDFEKSGLRGDVGFPL